jgi:hypothetical protein
MSDELSSAGPAAAVRRPRWSAAIAQELRRHADSRRLTLAVFALAAALMLAYSPFKQLEGGDPAIYDYIAQSVLRGQMPYRDVIDPKTPGSIYLSAAAMAAGRLIGIWDVHAVRLAHILFVGWLAIVTFLVAEAYLRNRLAAAIACVIPLMREETSIMMIEGTQPKLSMVLFGMIALLLIARNKPFGAGIFSMLSFLCWQPGLLFVGTAFLIFSRYLTSWRDRRALKLLAGAAVPLAVTILYFHLRGALGAMYEWTLEFPLSVFALHRERTLAFALAHLLKVFSRVFQWDTALLGLSLIGFVMFVAERLRARLKRRESLRSEELFRDAILLPPVVYLAFCLVNMQGGPDLIPVFPFIGVFGGWFFVQTARFIESRRRGEAGARRPSEWMPSVALGVILILALSRAALYKYQGWTVQYQEKLLKDAFADLGPNDKLYVHGPAEILLLLKRPNLNPYIAFDHGADDYIGSKRPGGFGAVIAEMEAEAPKFVAVSRLRNLVHRDELKQWIADHYEELPVNGYEIYRRKPD